MKGHHLNKHFRAQSSKFTGLVWKGFTIFRHGGHLGHVTKTIWTNFLSPNTGRLHLKYVFNLLSCFIKCFEMLTGGRILLNLNKGQRIILTFNNIISSFAYLAYLSDQISYLKQHTRCLKKHGLFYTPSIRSMPWGYIVFVFFLSLSLCECVC